VRVLWAGKPRRRPVDVPVALSPVDVVAGEGAVWTTSITARTGVLTKITPP